VLRVVQAGLGVGLVGASVAAAASGSVGVPTRPTHADIALVSVDDDPPTVRELPQRDVHTTTHDPAARTTTTTTIAPATTTTIEVVEPTLVEPLPADPIPAPQPDTWVVRHGDHFWAIAEHTLATSWGRAPADSEVLPYWRELVERNREALADRENADLIFPGQIFVLPAVPAAP
jgi:nucleoid-associated protein YgaU